ncbi:MAG: glycoside hydrolase family 2 protein [Bacteroidales bacterium]|nr:glycoside hydrolase family 2 protein [Bacteroidales bacterium]
MKRIISFLLPVLLTGFYSCSKPGNMIEINLGKGWTFKQQDNENWLKATVPGCVHTDLLDNGEIEDPFYRLNEHDLQWIDKVNWEYQTTFQAGSDITGKENIELHFKGLDTYAEVFLNDEKILFADNMFREWKVDIKEKMAPGTNTLRILFKSPIKAGLEKYDALDFVIPVSGNDLSEIGQVEGNKKVSVYTRKAQYHFGWDWGPRFVTSGIWKPVILRAFDKAIIRSVQVEQMELTDESAELLAHLDIESSAETSISALCFINGEESFSRKTDLEKGMNKVVLPLTIKDPQKWWPNGMGEQPLYDLTFKILDEDKLLSEKRERIGLRTIEVIQEPDSSGKSFYFKVNGHPVFMKGANYIPQDAFVTRVTPERYEHTLQSAVDANMNMLRVWGGGIYEYDIFYDLCDEKGILVWQDFMFACAMYPGDDHFLENVKQEAIDNIKRIRNHPSIALWCGNNECLSAWYMWGWKTAEEQHQGKEVADKIWKAYDDNYHKVLPQAIEDFDRRFYWSSSPSAGTGIPENWVAGDVHYWGVWWGKEPFVNYRTRLARFMSEYGFQSFPEMSTINKFTAEGDHDIYSDVMKSHQRSSIGNETIELYMLRDYKKPKDFEMQLYVGQLTQAEGIKVAMEGHRKAMPWCMGSLFWQIDDCWPVASWSSIDYYGRWKAQQYFAKKAFRDILISPEINDDIVQVFVVSDRLETFPGTVKMDLITFTGNTLWQKEMEVDIKPNSSAEVFSISKEKLDGDYDEKECLLSVKLFLGDEVYSSNIIYFHPLKDLDFPDPQWQYEIAEGEGGFNLTFTTVNLAKNIYVSADGVEGFFSDNFFDLLPGEEKTIRLSTVEKISSDELNDMLKVVTLVDSY